MRLLIPVFSIAAVAIWWSLASSPEIEPGAQLTDNVAAPSMTRVAPATQPASTPSGVGTAKAPSSNELLKKLNGTQSYRALFFDVIKHPETGGYLYAFAAFGMCDDDEGKRQIDQTEPERREALSILQARCDISRADRQVMLRELAAVRGQGMDRDPLMRLSFERLHANSLAEKQAALTRSLATGDPLLLREWINPEPIKSANGETSFELMGKKYAGKRDENMIRYALDLVDCALGMECGRSSTRALQLCVQQGWCANSVGEAIRLGLGANNTLAYAQVEALADQMIDAVRRKDVQTFLPPK